MINLISIYMLSGTVLSASIASAKGRSFIVWAILGIVAGPIAVAIVMWLPSRKPVSAPTHRPYAVRSIVDEIEALEDMRQRGMITDDEFGKGKAQILAWPVSSPIPTALSPQRVIADGRQTWAIYQPAARTAFANLARRHRLDIRWRDDVPLEVVATYPVQPGLSLEFTLGLEKGEVHCWGEGWEINGVRIGQPGKGIPSDLNLALDAVIEGSGRIVVRKSYGASDPFWVSLQASTNGRWRTIRRRIWLPWPPFWRRQILTNDRVVTASLTAEI